MQPIRHEGPLAEAAPAVIALDPARLLGGLPAQDATAGRVMVGGKQLPPLDGPIKPQAFERS